MKLLRKIIPLGLACGLSPFLFADTDLLAYFNFNNTITNASGTISTLSSTGSAEIYDAANKTLSIASDGVKASSAVIDFSNLPAAYSGQAYYGTTLGAYDGAPAGGAASLGNLALNGKYIVFKLNTEGYEDISLSFVTRPNNSITLTWEVSADGLNWVNVETVTPTLNAWAQSTIDLSSFEQVDDAVIAYMRFSMAGIVGNGNMRLENVQILGTAIPEPATASLLLGIFVLYFCMVRRRR